MREAYERKLEQLSAELTSMGLLCQSAIASAAKALQTRDMKLARHTIVLDEEVDHKEREIETICLKLLLKQQPVAGDLRRISAALKMITDLERIGDQAADICDMIIVAEIHFPADDHPIYKMAREVISMVSDSLSAYERQDGKLAQQVQERDDVIDELFEQVKKELLQQFRQEEDGAESAIDLIMIAKYLERIGDHATNIAEWAQFAITGVHPKNLQVSE